MKIWNAMVTVLAIADFARFVITFAMKRQRGENFSSYERNVFLSLCRPYIDTIECKRSDSTSLQQKRSAWIRIADDFNSDSQVTVRTSNQLRDLWERIKRSAKKETADELREKRKTGGGPMPRPVSDETKQIQSMIPSHISPPAELQNTVDSDTLPQTVQCEKQLPLSIPEPKPSKFSRKAPMSQSEYFSSTFELVKSQIEEKMDMKRKEHEAKMRVLDLEEQIKRKELEILQQKDEQQPQLQPLQDSTNVSECVSSLYTLLQ